MTRVPLHWITRPGEVASLWATVKKDSFEVWCKNGFHHLSLGWQTGSDFYPSLTTWSWEMKPCVPCLARQQRGRRSASCLVTFLLLTLHSPPSTSSPRAAFSLTRLRETAASPAPGRAHSHGGKRIQAFPVLKSRYSRTTLHYEPWRITAPCCSSRHQGLYLKLQDQ